MDVDTPLRSEEELDVYMRSHLVAFDRINLLPWRI